MGRFARGEAYDEQPLPDLDSEALDFRAASESFSRVRSCGGPTSRRCGCWRRTKDAACPPSTGSLLFGRERERQFPDAWIQAGRFLGTYVYAGAGHGFGIRDGDNSPASTWPAPFREWLDDRGFLGKK